MLLYLNVPPPFFLLIKFHKEDVVVTFHYQLAFS